MNEHSKTQDEDSAGISKVLDKILKEKQKIDRREGDIVLSHVRIAHYLAELRAAVKCTWGQRLKALGIHPRVAARYLKIAAHWPTEIGLSESDLLARLPVDLLKLEWLCRVPVEHLGKLLDQLDCKKATRTEVIAAVREALGEVPPKTEPNVTKFVDRCLRQLVTAIARLPEAFPTADEQAQAQELLENGLRQVLESFQSASKLPKRHSPPVTDDHEKND
jgi:hypothetical protein